MHVNTHTHAHTQTHAQDLKAYFAWLSEEERWADEDAADDLSDEDMDERLLTSAEWIHRAEIAKRLQNLSDAERALRAAALVGTSPKVLIRAFIVCVFV
jgi:hypothetical protein